MSFSKSMLALAVMAVSFSSYAAKQADLMIVDGTVLTMDQLNHKYKNKSPRDKTLSCSIFMVIMSAI